ncbi:chromodomain-helicase-DNA-binding protein 1 [Puccinia sorghi]|uniref:Chromodomain-helicase-DNA-binding protein 1 n=1 Tax=Puccinia sorghi TaxID=27349 RepID=A0A0L6VA80_9BASI|nr:chromodomain-helicase-DNA-binding protein 1 [Puccinia sorghi]
MLCQIFQGQEPRDSHLSCCREIIFEYPPTCRQLKMMPEMITNPMVPHNLGVKRLGSWSWDSSQLRSKDFSLKEIRDLIRLPNWSARIGTQLSSLWMSSRSHSHAKQGSVGGIQKHSQHQVANINAEMVLSKMKDLRLFHDGRSRKKPTFFIFDRRAHTYLLVPLTNLTSERDPLNWTHQLQVSNPPQLDHLIQFFWKIPSWSREKNSRKKAFQVVTSRSRDRDVMVSMTTIPLSQQITIHTVPLKLNINPPTHMTLDHLANPTMNHTMYQRRNHCWGIPDNQKLIIMVCLQQGPGPSQAMRPVKKELKELRADKSRAIANLSRSQSVLAAILKNLIITSIGHHINHCTGGSTEPLIGADKMESMFIWLVTFFSSTCSSLSIHPSLLIDYGVLIPTNKKHLSITELSIIP